MNIHQSLFTRGYDNKHNSVKSSAFVINVQTRRFSYWDIAVIFLLISSLLAQSLSFGFASATYNHKVTICHRTDSATNPYVILKVDNDSVDEDTGNDHGQGDHAAEHQGPIATSEEVAQSFKDAKIEWGDIIPPHDNFLGLNWTAEGQAIFNNGCNLPPKKGNLKVIKVVVNDNGGTKQVSDFPLFVGNLPVTSGQNNQFNPGTYTVSETNQTGYASAITGDCNAQGQVTLNSQDNKICTITNNDIAPKLTVTKVVVNNNSGTKQVSDFTLKVDTTSVTSGAQNIFNAGTHTVSEVQDQNYSMSISGDCAANGSITLNPGDVKACTITNDDVPPQIANLTVTKIVVNNNGGTKIVTDFPLFINTTSVVSGQVSAVAPGTYTVSETQQNGYSASFSGDCNAQGQVTLDPGDNKNCTITNDDIQSKLTLVKTVINDNGGTKQVSDFPLFIGTTQVTSGQVNAVNPGTYLVSETQQLDYSASLWGGDCSAGGSVTLVLGEDKTCTITNNDIAPTLKVIKIVVNNNGGTKQVSDFPLFVGSTQVTSDQVNDFFAGIYTVNETQQSGYTASFSGDCNSQGVVTLNLAEAKTCTITNDDIAPKLTVTKVVVNNNGGTKVVSDFTLKVDGNTVVSGIQNTFNAGVYIVSEVQDQNYSMSISGDCAANGSITLNPGDVKACTITNNDVELPQLYSISGIKFNDVDADGQEHENGEPGLAGWKIFIDENNNGEFDNGEISTVTDVNGNYLLDALEAGAYIVCEVDQLGWTQTYPGQNECHLVQLPYTSNVFLSLLANIFGVIIGNGGNATNVNFGNFQPPIIPGDATLTVIKVVVNNNGGTKQVSDFPLFINATSVTSGQIKTLAAGTYTVSETNQNGYNETITGDCNAQGQVILSAGQNKTCTITNDDIGPKLTVNKVVVNNNGGTKQVSDFTLKVDTTSVTSGAQNIFNAGTHTVSEVQDQNYSMSISGDCAANGNITLNPGDVKSCTITNDDVFSPPPPPPGPSPARLTVIKIVINDNGGTKQVSNFPLFVGSLSVTSGQIYNFNPGTYTVSETNQAGYTSVITGDCNAQGVVILQSGSNKTCTITNNDNPPAIAATVLTIVKSVAQSFTTPNGTLNYTIVVKNTSNTPAINVVLSDTLPAGLTYTNPPGGITRSWNLGNMAPGASQTVNYNVLVGANTVPGTYRNTAQVNSSNYQTIHDDADVEVRQPQVLGFSTLPNTGGPSAVLLQLMALGSLLSLLVLGALMLFARKESYVPSFAIPSKRYHKISASRMKARR